MDQPSSRPRAYMSQFDAVASETCRVQRKATEKRPWGTTTPLKVIQGHRQQPHIYYNFLLLIIQTYLAQFPRSHRLCRLLIFAVHRRLGYSRLMHLLRINPKLTTMKFGVDYQLTSAYRTVIICQQSLLFLLVFDHPLTFILGLIPSFSANASHRPFLFFLQVSLHDSPILFRPTVYF